MPVLLCCTRISVFNRSQRDSVNGEVNPIENVVHGLCGFIICTTGESSYLDWRLDNYWDAGNHSDVLADKDSTGTVYDWAIIMAASPDQV